MIRKGPRDVPFDLSLQLCWGERKLRTEQRKKEDQFVNEPCQSRAEKLYFTASCSAWSGANNKVLEHHEKLLLRRRAMMRFVVVVVAVRMKNNSLPFDPCASITGIASCNTDKT